MSEWGQETGSTDVIARNATVGAIILAGGLGQRLRTVGLKPFLLHGGKSFLQIAVENVFWNGLHPVAIVTNEVLYPRIASLVPNARILVNPQPERGMLSSVHIGLAAIGSECSGIFLCPIDYPLVQASTFHRLLQAHLSFPECIVQPMFNGRCGHPIVLPQSLFDAIMATPLTEGVRSMIHKYAQLRNPIVVDDPGILINVNTPEIYYQYCQRG